MTWLFCFLCYNNMSMEFVKEVLLDALLDSLKILPFIFLIYVVMELIENLKNKEKTEKAFQGKFAPVIASLTGIIPECGFSVMCSKLFENGLITAGALISAYISTSDEGLIILISGGAKVVTVLLLIAIKVVYAVLIGILVNLTCKKLNIEHVCPKDGDCAECGEHHGEFFDKYFLHPFIHAIKVFVYILIFNVVFGTLIYFIGENAINEFLDSGRLISPVITSLIGLIPNCASSTFIAEAYLTGGIPFGALISGLSANAGLGILLLLRNKVTRKKAIYIVIILFLSSLFLGYLTLFI